tara:strand:+ start:895 stop:1236 length:342 start_codon:yes stop_codon:yes gene_type:complete
MELSESIQEWVLYDNQLKTYSAKVKELRSKRNNLTESIFDIAEQKNLQNAVIEISDGKLKFQNIKHTSPLNFKFLKQCLSECINDEDSVKNIIEYIKQKREIKYINDIKRSYN